MKRFNVVCLLSIMIVVTALSQPTPTPNWDNQIITTIVGNGQQGFAGDGDKATNAKIDRTTGIVVDKEGNIYFSDGGNNRVRKVDTKGIISTIAGTGEAGYNSDGIEAKNAKLNVPFYLSLDLEGRLYIADRLNNRIRVVENDGTIQTVVGNGNSGNSIDGTLAAEGLLDYPSGIAIDAYGQMYISNTISHTIQKKDLSGKMYTIAGKDYIAGFSGDNGPSVDALLNQPTGITLDSAGNLYIAEYGNNRIRKIGTDGIITTVAGTGSQTYNGDGIPAIEAGLSTPHSVVIDKGGNIFIADDSNHRIRKIDSQGIIHTIAGNGTIAFSGDGSRAINATLNYPTGIVLDSLGNLYISDHYNYRIRKITNVAYMGPELTPTITPTPTSTPTPTATPKDLLTFSGDTLASNQLTADAPQGFTMGKVSFINIPTGNNTDGKGMEIKLAPGQGVWIASQRIAVTPSLAKVSGVFKASSKNVYIALVALNSPVDGQLAYTNFTGEEIPIEDYRQVNLFYEPPSRQVQVAVQVVNSPQSTLSATVWVDNLNVEAAEPEVLDNSVNLEVDGSFNEKGLEKLIVNLNETDGTITPFFESLTDIAIRLAIEPSQLAANLGTTVTGVADQFPLRLMGQVDVSRELPTDAGTLAFIMTNGFQNIGLFRFVKDIPTTKDANQEYLLLGGDFLVNNPNVPIYVVIQNAGPNIHSSVVIDDLMVVKK